MSLDLNNINVLNYNMNPVFVEGTNGNAYKFAASRDGIRPTMNVMTMNEIKAIYNNSEIIQTGWLTFEDDEKEAIFGELRMPEWKEILTNQEISDILRHPTADGLKKIVDIKSVPYFDRVRIELHKLIEDDEPVIAKVKDIVSVRHKELQNRKRNSSIEVREKDIPVSDDKAKELEEKNAELQRQLDAQREAQEQQTALMQQMMAELQALKAQNVGAAESVKAAETDNGSEKPKKSAGRPKKA